MVVFHNDIINAIAQARNIRHLLASDILERWQQGEEATAEQTQSLIQLGDWIDFLTDSEQLVVDGCIDSTDVWNIIQQIGEQAIGLDCVGTNYDYNNPPPTPTPNVFNYVESVTGLNTNNADPQNPVVRISVDGTTITGQGTPLSPLVASIPTPSGVQSVTDDGNLVVTVDNSNPTNPIVQFDGVFVDGVTITGDGTVANPLTGATQLSLETNGTPNPTQSLLNLVQGTNMTITDDGLGNVTFDAASGGVTSVTATLPITSSGGTTPNISTLMKTNRLIGRTSSGNGEMEEITVGSGLTLSGLTLTATGGGGGIPYAVASGTDTYTATVSGVTAYNDGDAYLIKFTNGNTTGCTLNISGVGAVTLYRNNDGALIGGDIWADAEMLCIYDSTVSGFKCIGTSPNSLFAYVTNDDSVTITKGQVVYAFGGTGDRMTVKLAYNTSDATSAKTVGVVLSTSIAANQKGIIIMQGLLDGLSNLKPVDGWVDGDTVYLGSTAGSITRTKQYAPNHLVYVGIVTTASAGSSGRMYVRVANGFELDEIHNVQAQSPSLNDTLWYDNTVSPAQWKTASISTILGYTPVTNARSINTSSPLSGGGNLTADRTISIADAVADGATKGAAAFTASDFNSSAGVISIDYTNGQAASGSNKGFLTSADWTTFNGKQDAITGGATTITTSNLTASRALASDASGKVAVATTTTTELNYVNGVTSAIQTQLDSKQPLTPRLQSATGGSVTPTSTNDLVVISATSAVTINNPTGAFVDGQSLLIRIKDNGTARTIAYGAGYRDIGVTRPTATVISKTIYLGIVYNSTDSTWDIIGYNQQA